MTTGPQAARMAEIDYATLHRWTVAGLVRPSEAAGGQGRPATYSPEDVSWICSVAALVRLGVRPSAAVEALERGDLTGWGIELARAASTIVEGAPSWAQPRPREPGAAWLLA